MCGTSLVCVCVCMCANECESFSLRRSLGRMLIGVGGLAGSLSLSLCLQVDELYEAFCIQSRLREGASRMKQAFSSSPSTKGTKESIAEVNRRYKEYTEVPALFFFFLFF